MNGSSEVTREDCQPWVISHPDLCGEVKRKPLCRGAVVGGGRPVQGHGQVRGHIEPVVGYRQVRSQPKIGQWPEFE